MAGQKKRVVIIGGGIAGMGAAHNLVDRVGDQVEVTVITKDPFYMTGPSRPLLLTGEQKYERMIRGYEEAAAKGINFVFGNVYKIDPAERRVYYTESPTRSYVTRKENSIEYDYLIVAPGIVFDGSSIEGYRENWHRIANVYEPGRVDVLKHRVWTATKGTVVVYAPPMPYRCAPAPTETAMAIDQVLRYRGVRNNFRIVHVDANPKTQPPVIADVVARLYEEAGIELITSQKIVEITPNEVVLESGEKIEYTILALLEPNRAPRFIAEAGLGDPWMEVRNPTDPRSPKYDDVLAAGDTAKLPFPKNQEIAYESALYASNKIIEELGGQPASVQYAFLGWAYVGNTQGKLETLSVQFGLNFTTQPPKPSKDPEPKRDYTLQKDRWEQSYLNRLFHPKEEQK
ncbi:pyridine nucleotide-disulfide oxidoreductase [Pyrodictium occultum]|uniref:Pyridine nucleotide-disulfide oxidoreductase n=1 Tax=Pyrodictium occultum TaxID=2309 RepID=A0A0V8RWW3_PYROC|nr:FAD-dependent oxidoreductase [Pyrodictium occultum]KSW12543.1 pyridine nucleotide-disulfide oxidoreductase [Pyrodictium occultum]